MRFEASDYACPILEPHYLPCCFVTPQVRNKQAGMVGETVLRFNSLNNRYEDKFAIRHLDQSNESTP